MDVPGTPDPPQVPVPANLANSGGAEWGGGAWGAAAPVPRAWIRGGLGGAGCLVIYIPIQQLKGLQGPNSVGFSRVSLGFSRGSQLAQP